MYKNKRVYKCKITTYEEIDKLREWAIQQNPSIDKSTHWWYNKLPTDICMLFYKIALHENIIKMFKENYSGNYNIDILNDMNELYVTAPSGTQNNNTSDQIFYTPHIDGPFYLFPFASCYRTIIGLDDNSNVVTCFNMIPENNVVKKGDIVAFDFHRECHYIYSNNVPYENNNNLRIIMKVHYCVYPKWAYYFGRILGMISIYYNKNFRNLFLLTLIKNNKYKKYLSSLMIIVTKIVHDIEYYIGYNNISYIMLIYILSLYTHNNIFLFGSSLVHYLKRINSNYNDCSDIILNRDHRFFYIIYLYHLLSIYYKVINVNTLLISQLVNIILYFLDISKLKDVIKVHEVVSLVLIYNLSNIYHIFIHIHLVLNFIENQEIGF
tara:strand:+ start:1491 stop:2630 length:1140 start_codon:yes stop_codon:yes gene_type:complete